MLRRAQRFGADLLPSKGSVLAARDPWTLSNVSNTGTDSFETRMTSLLLKQDANAAYHMFLNSPKKLKPQLLSQLLAIFPSGTETAHIWYKRAHAVSRELGSNKTQKDYAILINITGKTNRQRTVNALWHKMESENIRPDVNVWNQYIRATCDVDPKFWPWARKRPSSYASKVSRWRSTDMSHMKNSEDEENEVRLSTPSNDIGMLLQQMELQGVAPNSTTCELMLLSLGRQNSIKEMDAIIETIWKSSRRIVATESTILAIIEAYGFNNKLEYGFKICEEIYDLKFASAKFWLRLLRIALSTDEKFFVYAFNKMNELGGEMSLGIRWIQLEYLDKMCRFEDMLNLVPSLQTQQLKDSAIKRAVTGFVNTKQPLTALKKVKYLSERGIKVPKDVFKLIESANVDLQLLEIVEDEDDEDQIVSI